MTIENIFGFSQDYPSEEQVSSNNMRMEENQMMQEQALLNPNQTTFIPTLPSSYKGGVRERPVGGARKTADASADLFSMNKSLIQNLEKQVSDLDIEYITRTFDNLGVYPQVTTASGAPISQAEIIKKLAVDPALRKQFLTYADDYQENPNLDPKVKWDNIENRVASILLVGQTGYFSKRLNDELFQAAKTSDVKGSLSKSGGRLLNARSQTLFDESGKLRTKEEWNKYVSEKRNQEIQKINDKYDAIEKSKIQEGSLESLLGRSPESLIGQPESLLGQYNFPRSYGIGQTSDMRSWLPKIGGAVGDGKMAFKSTVYNPLGLVKTQYQRDLEKDNVRKAYSSLNYDELLSETINFYNDPKSGSSKFKAVAEKRFTEDNKGGLDVSQTGSIKFDFNNAYVYNEELDDYIIRDEIQEFNKLTKIIMGDESKGVLLYNAGKPVPEPSTSENKKESDIEDIRLLVKTMQEDRILGSKNKGPIGEIIFQGDIMSKEGKMYHVYNLTLNNNYINQEKFKGSKEEVTEGEDIGEKKYTGLAKKNNEIYSKEGFTVYIPSEISEKNLSFGKKYKQASTTSSVEALLNLTDSVSMKIPNVGSVMLKRDPKKRTLSITGNILTFDPSTGKYVKTDIDPEQLMPDDLSVDIDGIFINDYLNNLFKSQFYENNYLKSETLKQKGVKNPEELKPPKLVYGN